jgi:hypothetical protein
MSDNYGNVWSRASAARVVRVVEQQVRLTPEMLRWMNTPRDPSEAACAYSDSPAALRASERLA